MCKGLPSKGNPLLYTTNTMKILIYVYMKNINSIDIENKYFIYMKIDSPEVDWKLLT